MTQTTPGPETVAANRAGGDVLDESGGSVDSRRDLVPTHREAALTGAPSAPGSPAYVTLVDPEEQGPRLMRRVLSAYKALDPRGIASGHRVLPLLALTLLATVAEWDTLAFMVLLPLIKIDMGFDFAFMFGLLGAMAIMTTLLAPAFGYLSDRLHRVWMVRVGAIVSNIAAFGTALAGSPGLMVGSRLLSGTGQAIEQPARIPLLSDYYPTDRRARMYAFMSMGAVLGPGIAIFFIIFAAFRLGIGWRPILVVAAVVTTSCTILLFFIKEPIRGELDRLAMGASAEEAKKQQKPVSWSEGWRTASSIGTLRRLWIAAPFLTVAQFGLQGFLYFVLTAKMQRLISEGGGGPGASIVADPNAMFIFLAVPALLGAVTIGFSAPVNDRLMRYKPAAVLVLMGGVLALQAMSLFLFIISPWILPAMLFLFAVSALGGLILPAQYTILTAVLPPRIRGQGLQTIAPFQLLGYLMLPVVGAVGDRYGPLAAAYGLIPIFLIGAFVTGTAGGSVTADMRAAQAASVADLESFNSRLLGRSKLIVCRDVDVTYGGTRVLHGIDFDVEDGELVAVLGTNGAGKSTLLKAICGMHQASNGAIFLDGTDITHKPPHLNAADGIVFVPGGRAIFPTLTVEENLRSAAWLYRKSDQGLDERLASVFEHFPILRERLHEQAGNLSGGEQQMVALAQAFVMRPRLLMIDELSLGLAPTIVERLIGIVRAIHAQGTTVLLVEQSLNVAVTVAKRAVFMDKGEVRFDGPIQELLGRSDLVRAVFLGGAGGATMTKRGVPTKTAERDRDPALRTEDVAVSFGGVHALRGVSIDVNPGEIVGIIGPNGAGKTTLFDVASGFVTPSQGRVFIGGVDATSLAPDGRARLGLSRAFQNARLFPSMTVRENIQVALDRQIAPRSGVLAAAWVPAARKAELRAQRRADNLIDLLALHAFADKFVDELSTGSRRMVELACLVATDPNVVLLDEPSSGLAQAETELLGPTVQRLVRETGCGALVIEHDMPLITAMSDRLIAMELGQVLCQGPPDSVVNDPAVLKSYLAASPEIIQRSGMLREAMSAIGVDAAPDEPLPVSTR